VAVIYDGSVGGGSSFGGGACGKKEETTIAVAAKRRPPVRGGRLGRANAGHSGGITSDAQHDSGLLG